MKKNQETKTITNPDAYRNYEIIEEFEAGIVLSGTEVKSIRQGNANLKDSYAIVRNNELWLLNMYIKPYEFGNIYNLEPKRTRKLLMHKSEIFKLEQKVKQNSYTIIPIKMYFKKSYLKILLGLCKGKKLYDKRRDIKKRDVKRKIGLIKNKRKDY